MNNASYNNFLNFIQNDIVDHGGTCIFQYTRTVTYPGDGVEVNGYYDNSTKTLSVGMKQNKEKILPLIAHEYCHFLQWKENSKYSIEHDNKSIFFWNWMDGCDELPSDWIDDACKACLNLELDCERRTIDIITKHGLPIDVAKYAKQAESYIYFYLYMRIHRKWYETDREPYNLESVYSEFSGDLSGDFLHISKKIEDLYTLHCFQGV